MIPIKAALQTFWVLVNPPGLCTASGDINSAFVKLLFSMPDIFTPYFIFMTRRCSESMYSAVLNSLDSLSYLKNEAIINSPLLFMWGMSECYVFEHIFKVKGLQKCKTYYCCFGHKNKSKKPCNSFARWFARRSNPVSN